MKLWIKILVSFGVLALLLWILPWQEFVDSVRRLSWLVWLAVLIGFLAGHLLGAAKWSLLLRTLGAPLPWTAAVRCYGAGLFANLCLPGIVGGDVVRAAAAIRSAGRREAVVLGSLADRVIDLLALILILAFGSLVTGTRIANSTLRLVLLSAALTVTVGAVLMGLLFRRPLRSWPGRLRQPIGRTLVALRRLARRARIAVVVLALALSIQGGFVLLNSWIGHAIDIRVPTSVWFVVWPLAKLAGLVPVSLGGLGVRDATLGALLTGFGTPAARGVVASLVWQSILIAGGLLAGAYWWSVSRLFVDQRSAPATPLLPSTSKHDHGR